jgi:hypothetical protein
MSISHSLNSRTKSYHQLDPLEEFKAASLESLAETGLEDDDNSSLKKKLTFLSLNP